MWRRADRGCACDFRRRALAGLLIGMPVLLVAPAAPGEGPAARRIRFYNTHTREEIEATYHDGRDYVPAELGMLDWVLRDHRTSELMPMQKELFDLLHELAAAAGVEPRFEVISAYRSPATNAMLAATTDGVSSRSLHMEGRAIDVRLTGLATARLCELALARQAGGVGYYPESDFVHLDLGRVRSWNG
ncbi:MAG: DUF882 domain-containing protein [Gammaproteobacteria bacterium]